MGHPNYTLVTRALRDRTAPPTVDVMEWPFDETGEFRDQRFEYKDFTGTTIRESRVNAVRFVGVEMIDAEIDGYVEHLVINGVDVMPLVEAELATPNGC
jgi:hypothetical protein